MCKVTIINHMIIACGCALDHCPFFINVLKLTSVKLIKNQYYFIKSDRNHTVSVMFILTIRKLHTSLLDVQNG